MEYKECDTCAAKPGSPPLCSGCLYNRDLVQKLWQKIERLVKEKTLKELGLNDA